MSTLARLIIFVSILLGMAVDSDAQLNGNNYCLSSPTDYTTLVDNDSIFFYTEPNTGSLTASPESGVAGWDFIWQTFNVGTNSWIAYSQELGVPESTIENLAGGGYRVTIVDGNADIVGCHVAWISEFSSFPNVDVEPIPAGCGAVNLVGTIDGGAATAYYNAPPDPMIIDVNTEITVCFTANHTFVSDLGFYLVGPTTCGSPVIPLATSPGVCNGGNNITNLCFSTESTANFNVCTAATPLAGTFGTYGAGVTPINWTPLYGCDATTPGWTVQIYDCVGLDVGSLTGASISFNGTSLCGEPLSLLYSTPAGFNSVINDNSCSPQSASIFTVPIPPVTPLDPLESCGFLWTADPYFFIPDSTTSLNIMLDPGPTQTTAFTLSIVCDDDENIITSCGSGNTSDTEIFSYISPELLFIEDPGIVCDGQIITLIGSPPGGIWSGDNVDAMGTFDASAPGDYIVNYSFNNPCSAPTSINITVEESLENYSFFEGGTLCPYDAPVFLETCSQPENCNLSSNPAIIEIGGDLYFDPSLAIPGNNNYLSQIELSTCTFQSTEAAFIVEEIIDANLLDPGIICSEDIAFQLTIDAPGGVWSGDGILDANLGLFEPSSVIPGTVDLVYTTPGFCPVDETFTIQVQSNPSIELGSNITACDGEIVNLSAAGTWDQVSWTNSLNEEILGPAIDVSAAETWTAEVELNGCFGEDNITVNFTPIPTIDLGPDLDICEGETVVIAAPFVGDWSDSSSSNQLEVSTSGTYSYVYDNSGCPTGDVIEVNVLPLVEPSIQAIASLCEDAAVIQLNADIPGGSWSGTGITNSVDGSFNAQIAGPGSFEIEYNLPDQCAVTAIAQAEVVGFQNLNLQTPDPLCVAGEPIILEAGISGGEWSGVGVEDAIAGEFNPELSGVGNFDIVYTINGVCIDSDQITVEVQDVPALTIDSPSLICELDPALILTANLPGGTWSGDGISNENTGLFNPGDAGAGTHSITYQLDGVCSVNVSIEVDITSNPTFNLGEDISICEDQTAVVDAGNNWDSVEWLGLEYSQSIEINEEGTYTAIVELDGCFSEDEIFLEVITYPIIELESPIDICAGDVYSIEAPFPGEWNTGNSNSASIDVNSAGTYVYTFLNGGCPVIEEVVVDVVEYPVIDLVPSVEFCPGIPVTVDAGQVVTWSGVADGVSESIQVDAPGVLIAQKANGECVTIETVDVIELPLPYADLGPDIEGCLGDNYTLNSFSEVNDTYIWSTGDVDVEFISVSEAGFYSVQTSNSCGTAFDEISIKLEDCSALIFIPNAFTPDNDGINDVWNPVVRNLVDYKLQIFNRWGDIVFETEDWNEPWVGEYQDGDYFVQTGVYVYRITYTSLEGEAGDVNGHIVVLR